MIALSLQTIERQLHELLHRRQFHEDTIAYQKRGRNLLIALFVPNLRVRTIRVIDNERRLIAQLDQHIHELREQQIAALFLECWQEELARLPSTFFLTKE